MNPHRIYLSGELGKLAKGDAENFVMAVGEPFLGELGLSSSPSALGKRFSDQPAITRFVDGLSEATAIRLVELIDSQWRHNHVSRKLAGRRTCSCRAVPVAQVDVVDAEEDLKDLFMQLNHRLAAIAKHPVILARQEYAGAVGDPVAQPILLGEMTGDRCRVFDGVHRAVQLFRNREPTLTVCIPD